MALKFECPDCGGTRLECIESGPYSYEITNIDEFGDFEYGPIETAGYINRFQCLNCGFILQSDIGFDITMNEEVVEWCQKNCEQN